MVRVLFFFSQPYINHSIYKAYAQKRLHVVPNSEWKVPVPKGTSLQGQAEREKEGLHLLSQPNDWTLSLGKPVRKIEEICP